MRAGGSVWSRQGARATPDGRLRRPEIFKIQMDDIAIEKNKVKYNEWNAMVEACKSSGLTVLTWCGKIVTELKNYFETSAMPNIEVKPFDEVSDAEIHNNLYLQIQALWLKLNKERIIDDQGY